MFCTRKWGAAAQLVIGSRQSPRPTTQPEPPATSQTEGELAANQWFPLPRAPHAAAHQARGFEAALCVHLQAALPAQARAASARPPILPNSGPGRLHPFSASGFCLSALLCHCHRGIPVLGPWIRAHPCTSRPANSLLHFLPSHIRFLLPTFFPRQHQYRKGRERGIGREAETWAVETKGPRCSTLTRQFRIQACRVQSADAHPQQHSTHKQHPTSTTTTSIAQSSHCPDDQTMY